MEYGCLTDIRPSTTCSEGAYGRLLPLLCDGPEVISGECDNTQEEVDDIKEEQGQTETCKDKIEPMSLSLSLPHTSVAGDLQKLVRVTLREAKGAIGLAAGHAKEVSQQISNGMHKPQWHLASTASECA